MAATCTPDGKVSLNTTPVNEVGPGLVTVKVRVLVPLIMMVVGEKALLMAGVPITRIDADAVLPEPPSVEDILPVVFVTVPATVPVTFTLIVQDSPTPSVPLATVIELSPAEAEMVGMVLQVVTEFGVAATCRPPVKLSVKPTPVSGMELTAGLVSVKVRVLVALIMMEVGEKALLIAGGPAAEIVAYAAFPSPPSVEVTLLVWF